MRIALLAPITSPVPPPAYGSVETVVAALADGLVEAGHDVTLFATGDSTTKAKLVAVLDEPPAKPTRRAAQEVHHTVACLLRAHEFDVVSSHAGPLGGALSFASTTPTVHTVSDPMDRAGDVWRAIAKLVPSLLLIAVSEHQRKLADDLPWLAVCPNGFDLRRYPFGRNAADYLAFVGRMSADKGCHHAIAAARAVELPLRVGAQMREEHERAYFAERVEPHLGDGGELLGELEHEAKVELLGGALATLFPVEVEEAFGLVAAESIACGTPVVALRRGAIREIVEDGVTGFAVESAVELADAIPRAIELDRAACRRRAEQLFDAKRMVAGYEDAYERACRISVTPSRTVNITATTR